MISYVNYDIIYTCHNRIQVNEVKITYLESNLEDKDSGYNITCKGNYYLFSSRNLNYYVLFLGELDQSIYEIVDIHIARVDDSSFFVTYKKK